MLPVLELVLPLYYATLGVLAIFGAHRAVLLFLFFRHQRRTPAPAQISALPVVTVQLPLYNESYVARRLLDAVCGLDYPRHLLEIQVLDDSDDETTNVVAQAIEGWRAHGFEIHHCRRSDREGFKAGALEAGLKYATGTLIAIFDADFVPPADFLQRTVPWFEDPLIGMVQARWDHLNRRFSLLTRAQAILLDGHFRIEHAARFLSSRYFNFNGTAGVWRRRAIEDSGGWQHDTLTEDLDLSYRAQLQGWRFVYLQDLGVPGELPLDIAAFKSQQYRWVKGSVQTARKLLGRLLRSPAPWWRRLEALFHLTVNSCYPLMILLSLLILPAMLARRDNDQWMTILVDVPLFLAATVSVVAYYAICQKIGNDGEDRIWRLMPAVLALGVGLSVNNTRAVLSGLYQRGGVFVRTPKCPVDTEPGQLLYRARLSPTFLLEGLLSAYFVACLVLAWSLEMWFALPFLYLFLQGFGYVFILSVITLLRHSAESKLALARTST